MKCPDCGRHIEGAYRYALHRAFKHDDWGPFDKFYEEKKKLKKGDE